MTKFAEQLKHLRSQKGLSQEALAEQFHLSRQAISRWETGETAPDLDTLVKLASIFEVTLDELVTGVKLDPVVVEKVVEKNTGFWDFPEFDIKNDYIWFIPVLIVMVATLLTLLFGK